MPPPPRLYLDVETGGTDPLKHPLLTVAFAAENGSAASWPIRIEGDVSACDPAALTVNGIDPVAHQLSAMSLERAADEIEAFLLACRGQHTCKLIPVGWRILFDYGFLLACDLWFPDLIAWKRAVDLACVWHYEATRKDRRIPSGNYSLVDAHSEVTIEPFKAHTALGDALATRKVDRWLHREDGQNG